MKHLENRRLTGKVKISRIQRKNRFIGPRYLMKVEVKGNTINEHDLSLDPEISVWVNPTNKDLIELSTKNIF